MTSTLTVAVAAAALALALAASGLPCGAPVPARAMGRTDALSVDRAIAAVTPAVAAGTAAAPGTLAAERIVAPAGRVSTTYAPPLGVPVIVVRSFEPPAAPWAPGHRGVDLASPAGSPVMAPADGVVVFAGPVAGRPVLVVSHPDGLRSSLEPVTAAVRVGESVTRGQVVGTIADVPTHCAPQRCVHWGVRDGETYLDPMSLLPTRGPVVLLPFDE